MNICCKYEHMLYEHMLYIWTYVVHMNICCKYEHMLYEHMNICCMNTWTYVVCYEHMLYVMNIWTYVVHMNICCTYEHMLYICTYFVWTYEHMLYGHMNICCMLWTYVVHMNICCMDIWTFLEHARNSEKDESAVRWNLTWRAESGQSFTFRQLYSKRRSILCSRNSNYF